MMKKKCLTITIPKNLVKLSWSTQQYSYWVLELKKFYLIAESKSKKLMATQILKQVRIDFISSSRDMLFNNYELKVRRLVLKLIYASSICFINIIRVWVQTKCVSLMTVRQECRYNPYLSLNILKWISLSIKLAHC